MRTKDKDQLTTPQQIGESTTAVSAARCEALTARSSRELRKVLPLEHALQLGVLPLERVTFQSKNCISIACPRDLTADERQALRFCFGAEVYLVRVQHELFPEVIYRAYQGDFIETKEQVCRLFREIESQKSISSISERENTQHAASELLSYLLNFAWSNGASDLHLIPQEEGIILRLSAKGSSQSYTLHRVGGQTKERLLNYIVSLLNLPYKKLGEPIDGKFTARFGGRREPVRAHIFPTVYGSKAVLRLPLLSEIPTLDSLGFTEQTLEALQRVRALSSGLVVIAGSTGSGKSTTLYSLIQALAAEGKNIVTLEDPVERALSGISQTSLEQQETLRYSTAAKALLRQRPDVIMFSEIRDSETAGVAIEAALTGHLVLASVHCGGINQLATRFETLGVPEELLFKTLRLGVFQLLCEQLCGHCSVIDLMASRELGFAARRASGCQHCATTGYSGYCLVSEYVELGSRGRELRAGLEVSLEQLVRAGKLDVRATSKLIQARS